jgi:hypothetical protein
VAQVALDAVRGYAGRSIEPGVELVEFVLFSAEVAAIFRDVLGGDAGPSGAGPSAAGPAEAGGGRS